MADDHGLEAALRELHGTPDDAWMARCEDELLRPSRRMTQAAAGATVLALALLLSVLGGTGALDGAGYEGVRTVEAEPLCAGLREAPALNAAAPPPGQRCRPNGP